MVGTETGISGASDVTTTPPMLGDTSSVDLEAKIKTFRVAVFDNADIATLNESLTDLPKDIRIEFVPVKGSYGINTEQAPGSQEKLARLINEGKYDGLIIRSGTYLFEALDLITSLPKFIARAGVGVDNIDVAKASKRQIYLFNSPDSNSSAVAEHVFWQIGEYVKGVGAQMQALSRGEDPDKVKKQYKGQEIGGKTIGIIGPGNIGKRIIPKAIGFEMNVLAYDEMVPVSDISLLIKNHLSEAGLIPKQDDRIKVVENLDDLLANSDIITIHIPKIDGITTNYIDAQEIAKMKAGSILINDSREGIVNEAAVKAALESGHLAAYITDVLEKESPLRDDKGKAIKGVFETPHTAANTDPSQKKAAQMIANSIKTFFTSEGKKLANSVNFPSLDEDSMNYYDLTRLMAAFGTKYLRNQGYTIKSVTVIGRGLRSFNKIAETMAAAAGTAYGLDKVVEDGHNAHDRRLRDMSAVSALNEEGINVYAHSKDAPKRGVSSTITLEFEVQDSAGTKKISFEGAYDPHIKRRTHRFRIESCDKYEGITGLVPLEYVLVEHDNVPRALVRSAEPLSNAGFNIEGNVNMDLEDQTRTDKKLMIYPVRQVEDGPPSVTPTLLNVIMHNLNPTGKKGLDIKVTYVDLRDYTHTFQRN